MKTYAWRNHGCGTCSAQAAGEMIEAIEARDGVCTKQALLDASRPEDSPTHGAFEWDDSIAAEKYRLDQAHRIINNICVKIVSDDKKTEEKRIAFVNVTDGKRNQAQYKSVEIAFKDATDRDNVLRNALKELDAFQNKYGHLRELQKVFSALHAVKCEVLL